MNKNVATIRKIGGLGLAGVFALGASSAMAEDFNATTDVQSTLAITVNQDLNFGTLYAVTASDGEVDSLTLEPDGDIVAGPTNGTTINLVSLGGTITPAQGTVATSNVFTLDLPDDITTPTAGNIDSSGEAVEMTIAGGDPDVAKFLIGNFVVGQVVDGSINTGAVTLPDVEIDPDFGATAVTFNIGADIFTDDGAGNGGVREAYEDGTYSGTFVVTAEF